MSTMQRSRRLFLASALILILMGGWLALPSSLTQLCNWAAGMNQFTLANLSCGAMHRVAVWRGDKPQELDAQLTLARVAGVNNDLPQSLALCTDVLNDPGVDTGRRGQALLLIGSVHMSQGDYAAASAQLKEAAKLFEQVGDRYRQALVYQSLGDIAMHEASQSANLTTPSTDMLQQAEDAYSQSYTFYMSIDNQAGRIGLAQATFGRGIVAFARNQNDSALTSLKAALRMNEKEQYVPGQIKTLIALGRVQKKMNALQDAQTSLEQALALANGEAAAEQSILQALMDVYGARSDYTSSKRAAERLRALAIAANDATSEAYALLQIGSLVQAMSTPAEAKTYFDQAYAKAKTLNNPLLQLEALIRLGRLALLQNDFALVERHLASADTLANSLTKPLSSTTHVRVLIERALLASARSDYPAVERIAKDARQQAEKVNDGVSATDALNLLGSVERAYANYPSARSFYTQARDLAQRVGYTDAESAAIDGLAQIDADQSHYDAALASFNDVLQTDRRSGNRPRQSATLSSIAQIYFMHGQYPEARTAFSDALAIAQQVGVEWGEAGILVTMAHLDMNQSDYEAARAKFDRVMSIAQKLGIPGLRATALSGQGELAFLQGELSNAKKLHQQALEIYRTDGGQESVAEELGFLGDISAQSSDYRAALQSYTEARAALGPTGSRLKDIQITERIAALQERQGHYADAISGYTAARTQYEQLGLPAYRSQVIGKIASAQAAQGEYEAALRLMIDARDTAHALGNTLAEASQNVTIGSVYGAIGDYARAQEAYEDALGVFEAAGIRGEVARIHQLLAGIYQSQGKLAQAKGEFDQALQLFEAIGDRAAVANVQSLLGGVLAAQNQPEAALPLLRQALQTQQDIGVLADEVHTQLLIGSVHMAQHQYTDAEREFREALLGAQQIGLPLEIGGAYAQLATLGAEQGHDTQALSDAQAAVGQLELVADKLQLVDFRGQFVHTMVEPYDVIVKLLTKTGRYDEALTYAQRARTQTLLSLISTPQRDDSTIADQPLIQEEQRVRAALIGVATQLAAQSNLPSEQRSQQQVELLQQEQRKLQQTYADVLTRLHLAEPGYTASVSPQPLDRDALQALVRSLDSTPTAVSYYVGAEQTAIFVIGPNTFTTAVIPVTRQDLQAHVQVLLTQIKNPEVNSSGWHQPAQELYDLLIKPIAPSLPTPSASSTPALLIVPDGPLMYIPFDVLEHNGHTLIDDYTISSAPSLDVLNALHHAPQGQPNRILAIGNAQVPGLEHLPNVEVEATTIATLTGGDALVGSNATETRLKQAASHYRILHIAAHSDFQPGNPTFSALMLRGDDQNDGRLETHEILNLDLRYTDLVVLSACETRLSVRADGAEVIDLGQAFLGAGASNLVLSFWLADDASSALLMQQFYTNLQSGMPVASALRQAKQTLRSQHPEPFFWATFVSVGRA